MADDQEVDLADRYVALWNEPDRDTRRELLRAVWVEDGVHRLDPPKDLRDSAAAIGFRRPALEARGYEELEDRVSRAHEEFVAHGEFVFRHVDDVGRIGNLVKFHWQMLRTDGGDVAAAGLEILVVDDDDLRIREDYQFVER
jgi:hypothetical protein